MSLVPARLIPSDVRQVIDRTDCKLDQVVAGLTITGDQMAEVVSLLIQSNKLLVEQNMLLRGRR